MSGKVRVNLVGRVAVEPEMRYTAQGKAVTSIKIPVQERKDGETTWWKVVAWEKQAETLNQYATKGTWLSVDGVPSVETWQDKGSGETRVQLVLTVRDFTFCGGGEREAGDTQAEKPSAPRTAPARQTPAKNAPQVVDEDLPF